MCLWRWCRVGFVAVIGITLGSAPCAMSSPSLGRGVIGTIPNANACHAWMMHDALCIKVVLLRAKASDCQCMTSAMGYTRHRPLSVESSLIARGEPPLDSPLLHPAQHHVYRRNHWTTQHRTQQRVRPGRARRWHWSGRRSGCPVGPQWHVGNC